MGCLPHIVHLAIRAIEHMHLTMKTILYVTLLNFALLSGTLSAAEAANTYQVTGPVLEITDKAITVQKGDEKWEISRDANTKIKGELKVGSKVTIQYRMHAVSVEVKAANGKEKQKTK